MDKKQNRLVGAYSRQAGFSEKMPAFQAIILHLSPKAAARHTVVMMMQMVETRVVHNGGKGNGIFVY